MGKLDGKVAIVTGASRGIGLAIAELFAAEGAKVLINDLDADVAEQTASELDGDTIVFGGDLTKPGVCDELVAKTLSSSFLRRSNSAGLICPRVECRRRWL